MRNGKKSTVGVIIFSQWSKHKNKFGHFDSLDRSDKRTRVDEFIAPNPFWESHSQTATVLLAICLHPGDNQVKCNFRVLRPESTDGEYWIANILGFGHSGKRARCSLRELDGPCKKLSSAKHIISFSGWCWSGRRSKTRLLALVPKAIPAENPLCSLTAGAQLHSLSEWVV